MGICNEVRKSLAFVVRERHEESSASTWNCVSKQERKEARRRRRLFPRSLALNAICVSIRPPRSDYRLARVTVNETARPFQFAWRTLSGKTSSVATNNQRFHFFDLSWYSWILRRSLVWKQCRANDSLAIKCFSKLYCILFNIELPVARKALLLSSMAGPPLAHTSSLHGQGMIIRRGERRRDAPNDIGVRLAV